MGLNREKLKIIFAQVSHEQAWFLSKPRFVTSTGIGILTLIAAYLINYEAGRFATANASNPVRDTLLELLPVFDTAYLHVAASNLLILVVLTLLFILPRHLPFALLSLSLLIFTRIIFINMTYLGIHPEAVPIINSGTTFGGDLFFSGHVAIPFLFALIFWRIKLLRYAFLGGSMLLGLNALLGHVHYSIDIFAAPFIAYGIFSIAKKIFVAEYQYIKEEYPA